MVVELPPQSNETFEEIQELCQAMKNNHVIRKFQAYENSLSTESIALLCQTFRTMKALEILEFGRNKINYEKTKEIAAFIKNNQSLTELHLQQNAIGPKSMEELAKAIQNKSISYLDLHKNALNVESSESFFSIFQDNRYLKKIRLDDNDLKSDGIIKLCSALNDNHIIQELDISYNHIDDHGAEAISNLLQKNKSLHSLTLDGNPLGDNAAYNLSLALLENNTLTYLGLYNTNIEKKGKTYFIEALEKNFTLVDLSLKYDVETEQSLAKQIFELIKRNKDLSKNTSPTQTSLPKTQPVYSRKNTEQTKVSYFFRDKKSVSLDQETIKYIFKLEEDLLNEIAVKFTDLNQALRNLNKQLSSLEIQKDNLNNQILAAKSSNNMSDANLKKLQAEHQLLIAQYETKVQKYRAIKNFKKEPNLWQFYNTFAIRLEQIFIGMKAAASELTETGLTGYFGKASTGLSLLSKLSGLIPALGDTCELILSGASEILEYIDKERQTNILKSISKLGTLSDLQKLSVKFAREMTDQYHVQIKAMQSIKTSLIRQYGKKVSNKIFKSENISAPEMLAEYGIMQILSALLDGSISPDLELETQFLSAILNKPTKLDRIKQTIISIFGSNEIICKSGEIWQLDTIYHMRPTKILKHPHSLKTEEVNQSTSEADKIQMLSEQLSDERQKNAKQMQAYDRQLRQMQEQLSSLTKAMSTMDIENVIDYGTMLQIQSQRKNTQSMSQPFLKQHVNIEQRVQVLEEIVATHYESTLHEEDDRDPEAYDRLVGTSEGNNESHTDLLALNKFPRRTP